MKENPESILQVLEAYKTAVLEKNVQAFMQLYDKDARVFDTWEVWVFEGKDSRLPIIKTWFESLGSERVFVNFDDVLVTYSQDVAMVSAIGTYTAVSTTNEVLRSMQNRFTWTLKLFEGSWQIIHEHTSVPIADDLTAKLVRDVNGAYSP